MLFENIPIELRQLPQWVLWRLKERNGKKTKIPYQVTGYKAKSNTPDTWNTFEVVTKVLDASNGQYSGIGLMFSENDNIVGIDFDKVIDDAGKLLPDVDHWLKTVNSYAEYSQSGKGLHILCRGKIPGKRRKNPKKGYEIYCDYRYFVMTGKVIEDYKTIECRQEALDEFYKAVFPEKKKEIFVPPPSCELSLDESKIIELCQKAKNSQKFDMLFSGKWENFYNSQSEADLALCNILAFYIQDEVIIDSIFQRSGLYREKWDREDYKLETIRKAIENTTETYSGNKLHIAQAVSSITSPVAVFKEEHKKEALEVIDANYRPIGAYTETWNAEQLVEQYEDNIRYCHDKNKWLIWTGKRWKIDRSEKIQKLAKRIVRSLYGKAGDIEDKDKRFSLVKWAMKSESKARRKALVELAQCEVPILPEDLDKNIWLLAVKNGTLDLKDCVLKPHNREDYITKILDVNYNSEANCPIWIKFLNDIFEGNSELIRFAQKAIGYCLTGSTQEQCIFILHGPGANGKSTFLGIIAFFMGEYAQQLLPDSLMKKRFEGVPEDMARLQGKRLAIAVETGENRSLDEVKIKQLTGGDKVTGRFMRENTIEYLPSCKIWLSSNHKPNIRGTDFAMWRRIRLIPFNYIIPEDKKDLAFIEKLKKEKEGILNWAIEGLKMWRKEGLKAPEEVTKATDEYKNEMDTLGRFIDDCCVLTKKAEVSAKKLYTQYKLWTEDVGEKAINQKTFGMKFKEKGFEKFIGDFEGRRNITIYRGIGLKEITSVEDVEDCRPFSHINSIVTRSHVSYIEKSSTSSTSSTCDKKNNKIYNEKISNNVICHDSLPYATNTAKITNNTKKSENNNLSSCENLSLLKGEKTENKKVICEVRPENKFIPGELHNCEKHINIRCADCDSFLEISLETGKVECLISGNDNKFTLEEIHNCKSFKPVGVIKNE